MKRLPKLRIVSGLLALGMAFTMTMSVMPRTVRAAPVEVGQMELIGNQMTVVMDENFPRVIEYQWGDTGKVLYGQSSTLTEIMINQIRYQPTVTIEKWGSSVEYHLDFTSAGLNGVEMKLRFTLQDNILEMKMTEILDPAKQVRYIEFPSQSLISVRSSQPGAAMAYNANFANGDTFQTVAAAPLDSSPKKIGHVFLSTNELAAAIESDMTCQYNYIQTVDKGDYKETGVWTTDFMYRGPDKTVTELPWCKITITDDKNEDGQVNWQDAAVAYRQIMDPLSGENLARKTIAVNILLNYWGRQSWTWENGLDYVKRQAQATDNFPQIMLVKGAHNQFGDGWPSYGDANPLLGGNDALRRLISEAEKYNVYVGTHTNSVEAYPESPFYEETPKYNGGVWDFVDRGGTAVDDIEYWSSGLLDQRYEAHKSEFEKMKFQYLDVSAGRWDGKEARWTTWKTLKKFQELDWTYFTEMYLGYVNYTLNDTTTKALSPKYVNWCHTYFFGGESNGGNHGNSNIRRFIINDQAIYEAGTQEYQNVLGSGYQKSYGYLGWSEAQTTVSGAVKEFWQHTLADTYLKNFPILSIGTDAANNGYLTARFEDGVTSVFNGSKRIIAKNGIVYAELNDSEQDIFIPWEARTEDKIYTYRSAGGSRTWKLPESWAAVTEVSLYALDQVNGKTLVESLPVIDGQVTISYQAGQGYVLTKTTVEQPAMVWGDGSPIADGNFNSAGIEYWSSDTPESVSVERNPANDNLYLNISEEASASQEIQGLEAGKEYLITALTYTPDSRSGSLEVQNGSLTSEAVFTGANYRTIMGNCFNNWTLLKAHFTAESDRATVTLRGLAGSGAVYFDDLRFYEETNPYGAEGHYYYDDLETSHMMGAFVHENGEMGRLAYANNGVNQAVQLDGQRSILMSGRYDTIIKTTPGSLKILPNTGYDLHFTFKSSYGPANGWKYTIISPSTGKKLVNQYLSGYEGQVVNETISFKTDENTDYILVFTNAFARATSESDLAFDDITLDLNPAAVNPELMPDDYKEKEAVLVEAEAGIIRGSAMAVQDAAASGGYAVGSFQEGDTIQFNYLSSAQRIRLRYRSTQIQQLQLIVNGEERTILELPATDGEYKNISFDISLPTACTVVLKAISAESLFLDLLELSPIYEAENATASGWTGQITDTAASGGRLVWLNDQNRNNTKLSFTMVADATTLTIRYANEQTWDRLLDIYVNGQPIATNVVFPYTGPRGANFVFAEKSFPISLGAGDVLELRAPVGESKVTLIDCVMTNLDETKIAQKVELDQGNLVFDGEVSQKLTAIISPETAEIKSVSWKSDDPQVAIVRDGEVIPVGLGTTNVRVTLSSGKSTASCKVEVKALPHQGSWIEAESGTSGINSYVAGRTSSAIGETLVWMNSRNWNTGVAEYSYWSYTALQDADGIVLRYANQLSVDRLLSIQVNGDTVIDGLAFAKTGNNIVCAETIIPLTLKKGDQLRFTIPLGESNGVMIDKFAYVLGISTQSLQTLIDRSEALEQSEYNLEAWQNLATALASAKTVLSESDPSTTQIATAMDSLWQALDGLIPREPVSIQQLRQYYDSLVLLDAEDYTRDTWATLEATLASAETVLLAPAPSQTEVNQAYDRMVEAADGLLTRGDTTVLNILVNLYAQLLSQESQYTAASWQTFSAAYTTAQSLCSDPENVSAEDALAAEEALEAAVENLQLAVDKTPVEVLLEEAMVILDGDTSIYITSWVDNLRLVVSEAGELLANPEITDQDVMDMAIRLNQALASMFEKGNNTALKALVRAAERLQETRFTPDTWSNLPPALQEAQRIALNESEQTEIDQAWQELSLAINQLILRANFNRLLSAIGVAENIWQNKDRYEPSSIQNLETTLQEAKLVKANLNSSQDTVNQMTERLLSVTAAARYKTQKDALEEVMQQALAIDMNLYTPASADRLSVAILQGQALLASTTATQGEVDEGVALIKSVLANLEHRVQPPVSKVDKERLGAILSQTGSLDRTQYTADSLRQLDEVRDLGKAYMLSETVSQEEINSCIDRIMDAWNGLGLLLPQTVANRTAPKRNTEEEITHNYRPAQIIPDNGDNSSSGSGGLDKQPQNVLENKTDSELKTDISGKEIILTESDVLGVKQVPWPVAMVLGLVLGLGVAALLYGIKRKHDAKKIISK